MIVRITILFLVLIVLIVIESQILKKKIIPYHALTWALVELFWYLISFSAVCIGLVELERIERLNRYAESEKALYSDYIDKKNLLHAQTWILKLDGKFSKKEEEGVLWFHKMKSLYDEGMYTNHWEDFLLYSRSYLLKEPGVYSDASSNALQFGWPKDPKLKTEEIFLKEEIKWVVDSLKSFHEKKQRLLQLKPEENTNYKIRYYLIFFFLVGLSLKIVKIYADYIRVKNR